MALPRRLHGFRSIMVTHRSILSQARVRKGSVSAEPCVQESARLVHIFNWQSCQNNYQECATGSICSCASTGSISTVKRHESGYTLSWDVS